MTISASYWNYLVIQDIYDRGVALGNYMKDKIANMWGKFATFLTSFYLFTGRTTQANMVIGSILHPTLDYSQSNEQRRFPMPTRSFEPDQDHLGYLKKYRKIKSLRKTAGFDTPIFRSYNLPALPQAKRFSPPWCDL